MTASRSRAWTSSSESKASSSRTRCARASGSRLSASTPTARRRPAGGSSKSTTSSASVQAVTRSSTSSSPAGRGLRSTARQHDAPPGTLVFVRDQAVRRGAVAEEAGTTVLVVGGVPGRAFAPSPWEAWLEAYPSYRRKEFGQALEIMRGRPRRVSRQRRTCSTTRRASRRWPGSTTPLSSTSGGPSSSSRGGASGRSRTRISTRSATTPVSRAEDLQAAAWARA